MYVYTSGSLADWLLTSSIVVHATLDYMLRCVKVYRNVCRVVLFVDIRFDRNDKRSKLPPWVTAFMHDTARNLSSDLAIEQVTIAALSVL